MRGASREEWDEAYAASDIAYYFQSRQWAEHWARAYPARCLPKPVRLQFDDGQIVTIPRTIESRLAGILTIDRIAVGHTYGGWLTRAPITPQHREAVIEYLNSRPLVRFIGSPLEHAYGPSIPSSPDDVAHLVDLSLGIDAIRGRASGPNRRAAEKAIRTGVTVRVTSQSDDWRTYYQMYRSSLERWGGSATTRYGAELFQSFADAPTQDLRLWLAERDMEAVAGAVIAYGRGVVAYWAGASLTGPRFPYGSTNLLLSRVLEDAWAGGYVWFDFLACGGHMGVHRFKESFGPVPATFPTIATNPALLRLARRAGALIRRA